MSGVSDICEAIRAETDALMRLLDPPAETDWERMTPAEGWTVTDQVAHLAYFDEKAALAITDPAAFADSVNEAVLAISEGTAELHRERGLDGPGSRDWFVDARRQLLEAADRLDPHERVPWYGPPMRPHTFLIARLMETWAHGTDVADALGTTLPPSDRLFHIAELGVRTFSWSFSVRDLEVPEARVRVELTGPTGTTSTWNEESAESVTGPVEDFCLVVTQRRHVDDTRLVTDGPLARQWMELAQAFAGPAGPGRPPNE